MSEKIHKALARAGYGSRRAVEGWIREGRVTVNGRPAQIGERVSQGDRLTLDGRQVNLTSPVVARRVLAYHKPEGEVCTASDPEGRPTIMRNLPTLTGERWISIGRLDINTSGLILFTNDGDLAHRLMHPSGGLEREYAVRVLGKVTPAILRRLTAGVPLEDGRGYFDAIFDAGGTGANHWYHVILREGRNRLVRRLWESQGLTVSRLIRVRFGTMALPSTLKVGRWKELNERDIQSLEKAAGLQVAATDEGPRERKPGRSKGPA